MTWAGEPRSLHVLLNLSRLGIVGSLAATTLLLRYLAGNHSHHTGFEPWLLSVIYAPTAIIGFTAWRHRIGRQSARFACCVGVAGLAFLLYLDYFNVLVEYERWINRGMP